MANNPHDSSHALLPELGVRGNEPLQMYRNGEGEREEVSKARQYLSKLYLSPAPRAPDSRGSIHASPSVNNSLFATLHSSSSTFHPSFVPSSLSPFLPFSLPSSLGPIVSAIAAPDHSFFPLRPSEYSLHSVVPSSRRPVPSSRRPVVPSSRRPVASRRPFATGRREWQCC